MKKEEALKKSAQGYAHRVSSRPGTIYFARKDGSYWSSFGESHKKLTKCVIDRLPVQGWVPDFPNAFWAEKIGGFVSEPAKPGLLQLITVVQGYKDLIGSLGAEIESCKIGDDLQKPLAELAEAVQALQELL